MIHIQERTQMCIAKIIQNNPRVKNIFDEIYQQGGRVLLVGGAVRDCLLGCLGSDLDFEVYHLSFEELQDILEKFGQVSFIGKSFGVLRLHGFDADWSIPRKDSYGRKPTVELDPDMNFDQAFRRRDLTINAMGIDIYSQELIDPFDAHRDLQNKILRSPDVTFFVQDPLRLFRVMQFTARFDMPVNSTLSQVCRTMDISGISTERITQEFYKLFTKAYKPSIGLKWLYDIGRFSEIFPNILYDDALCNTLDCIAQHVDFTNDQKIIASWAFLMGQLQNPELKFFDISQPISQIQIHVLSACLYKYIGSHDLVHKIILVSWYMRYLVPLVKQNDTVPFKWLAHWIAPDISIQFLIDVVMCYCSHDIGEHAITLAKAAKVLYKEEEPLLMGNDLLSYAQGKQLGDLLKVAYQIQLESSVNDKHKLLQLVLKNRDL